ncbi:MAG: MerR family transcriptional regulator [Acidimicrobiales bacterium]|nr:MerR family transcriptional regulator [Acidimicrobiales bacterium]
MTDEMHQIGEVATQVGLSLRTIRHYEEVDLAPPSGRTSGGFRLYTDDDIERLHLVKDLKPLGFTLEEMRQVLNLRARLTQVDPHSDEAEDIRDLLAGFAVLADERCDELRAQLRTGEAMADLLRREARPRSTT